MHLRAVLNKLKEASLTTEAIAQFPQPETKKQVQSFLGLIGYYQCYLASYASMVAPLTNVNRKCEPEIVS